MNFITPPAVTVNAPQVIASLRKLVPSRMLTRPQTMLVSELQAVRLRELLKITTPHFPHDVLMNLRGVEIEFDGTIPYSGSTHWNGKHWVIVLNATESKYRQRFSLLHELKHIVDHTTKQHLYGDTPTHASAKLAEQTADYFAACVLMPETFVQALCSQGIHGPNLLCKYFEVSQKAMYIRLKHLNLKAEKP